MRSNHLSFLLRGGSGQRGSPINQFQKCESVRDLKKEGEGNRRTLSLTTVRAFNEDSV